MSDPWIKFGNIPRKQKKARRSLSSTPTLCLKSSLPFFLLLFDSLKHNGPASCLVSQDALQLRAQKRKCRGGLPMLYVQQCLLPVYIAGELA